MAELKKKSGSQLVLTITLVTNNYTEAIKIRWPASA